MNTQDLRHILAISEHNSISRAAEAMFVSQPYLSKVLSKVEDELGLRLFDRSHVPLQPTYAGEKYLEYCRRFLKLEQEFTQEFHRLANSKDDRLIVGTPPIRGSYLLPLVLPEFSEVFPNTEVVIREDSSDVVPDKIAGEQVDLGMFAWSAGRTDLAYTKLLDERMLLMVPAGHPLHYHASAGEPLAVLSEDMLPMLSGEKFISIDTPKSITKQVINYLQQHGIRCGVSITTQNNITTYRLCERGMGLAVIMEVAMCNTIFYNQPCFYQIGTQPMVQPWYCAYKKGRQLSPASQYFLQLVRQHAPEVLIPRHL